jgi:hypothetical protein
MKKTSIYQIKWMGCPLKQTGQSGRKFRTRYKKHIQAIKNNNNNSGYSEHAYGSITNIIGIIKREKRKTLKNIEKCHIQKSAKKDYICMTYIDTHHPIFDTLRELNSR